MRDKPRSGALLPRVTRRSAMAALGAAALFLPSADAQEAAEKNGGRKAGADKAARTTPLVCAFSQNLIKVPYAELGMIAQQIGYDGVDLTVMPGGHVDPHIINVDLVRAIESVRGAGLEVPMITTMITSVTEPTSYGVMAITGHTDVHLYRLGFWPYQFNSRASPADIPRRLAEVRNDLTGLVVYGQRAGMTAMFPNRAGSYVGEALWDAQSVLGEMDPKWIGYYFDPSQATAEGGLGGWEVALRLALPRLKAVAVQDFIWTKTGEGWKMQMCPMGEGMVDWASFFRILAQSGFTGPISMHMEYQQQDELGAMTKDLQFVRKQIEQAWGAGATAPSKP